MNERASAPIRIERSVQSALSSVHSEIRIGGAPERE